MNKQRLFITSCISIGTAAMVFAIRGDVAGPMSAAFHITNEQMGVVFSPAFFAFTLAIFISGNLVDVIGMRALHALSAAGFIAGVLLVILAPHPDRPVVSLFDNLGTTMLFGGFFTFGLSHGLVEGVINPLLASMYSTEKTKKIVACHAWWPAGLIVGGLLAVAMTKLFAAPWQLKLLLIAIPAATYLIAALTQTYPQSERVASNVSTADMWKETMRPIFLLLFLVCTAGLMFVIRMWGSAVSHKSPLGTLVGSSALAGLGLYWLGGLDTTSSAAAALAAATIFGIGKTFLWPTMIGVTAELFPRGGPLLLSLMGGAGMLSVGLVLPVMGAQMDRYGPGAALQMVAALGAILTVIFGALWGYFKLRGGYRVVHISAASSVPNA